ncbi:AAA family ATPase [Corallincola holothuriorum]|uniref:AAA family ATPase n=1 Tax=Corallincola holothuriorum TaxID=2282215 RepID=A0A368NNP9_9GAMM|nr:ExeA family protein [Corallincola holothuriorum]RCU51730.1 AAA family ATPase [Corallincola holothuriorum]
MYTGFFALRENPFSIAPNPQYLYMSDRHREALAHLMFGLGETGGFVLLTGEVGTGKTTVSRCLMEQLPAQTETAFVLNPTLTEHELLATICDEFHVQYPSQPTLKQLTDTIHQHLLRNHEAEKTTVLIIDEAQHLRPEVLEQLRLLTNLETHTKKLLQVILIGQPELQELLQRKELRQLAQRITARYHLLPLTEHDVANYVAHRLQVAGSSHPLFTKRAVKRLHQLSGGIPRVINLLCDRALLGAYSKGQQRVDHHLISKAASEALGLPGHAESGGIARWPGYLAIGGTLAALVVALTWLALQFGDTDSDAVPRPVQPALAAESDERLDDLEGAEPATEMQLDLPSKRLLASMFEQSREIEDAFAVVFNEWDKSLMTGIDACEQAKQNDLACYWKQGSLHGLLHLNRPAVVRLIDDTGEVAYGAMLGFKNGLLKLVIAGNELEVSERWFERYWKGSYAVLWQPPVGYVGPIGWSAKGASVQWLETSLGLLQGERPRRLDGFDSMLGERIRRFQREQRLEADGIAGVQTLIRLNQMLQLEAPTLMKEAG